VSGFRFELDGKVVVGEVDKRQAARERFEQALVEGKTAALLEQERPNVFTAQVGNLLPNEETTIEIEYVQRVRVDEGALRVMIPTLVAPRYVPGKPQGDRTAHGVEDPTDQVPDADRISPPRQADIPYRLKLDLAFELGPDVEVESPSHPLAITRTNGRVHASFAQREVALDRDVVIVVRNAKDEPLTVVAADRKPGGQGTFAVTVVPDLHQGPGQQGKDARQDVVFLVDVSGSMDGASIVEAREALRLSLRHLREGDRFTIVAFQSEYHTFSSALVPFTQRTLEQADAWVRDLRAGGGTEILPPLLWATKAVPDGVLVLLTDAEVGNEDEIHRAIAEARGAARTRIYSFGIGTNVNDALLRELARTTGGAVELIHPGERIDEKVVGQFARALAARVTDVRVEVEVEGADVGELAPSECPSLVDGEPWVVLGRYAKAGRGKLHVRGKLRGEAWHLAVTVDLPEAADHPALPKLWAAERIREWEAASLDPRRQRAMKERITKLAVEHGIASRYTAFVVVEKREGARRASGQPETRVIPVGLPAGWAMFQQQGPAQGRLRGAVAGAINAYAPMSLARPMSRMSPAPSAASAGPVPPMPASPQRMTAKAKGGLIGRAMDYARDAFGGGGPKDDAEAPEIYALEEAEGFAMADGGGGPSGAAPTTVGALLGQQLASGLFGKPGADDAALLVSTARVLVMLVQLGLTTSHEVHGGQIRKAVDAFLVLAPTIAARDPKSKDLALGLAAAWLLASGRRTRKEVEAAIAAAHLDDLSRKLDEAAMRSHLDALSAG
jgi:Ca-activated chloride channel family protein